MKQLAITQSLERRMKSMQIGGRPITVATNNERMAAHNVATRLGMTVKTRARIGTSGYEVHRTK